MCGLGTSCRCPHAAKRHSVPDGEDLVASHGPERRHSRLCPRGWIHTVTRPGGLAYTLYHSPISARTTCVVASKAVLRSFARWRSSANRRTQSRSVVISPCLAYTSAAFRVFILALYYGELEPSNREIFLSGGNHDLVCSTSSLNPVSATGKTRSR